MEDVNAEARVAATIRTAQAVLPPRATTVDPASVRRVVAILASSRGGSSLLFHLLRSTGAFLSLPGEHTHLYKLHGLGLGAEPDAHDGEVSVAADHDGFAQHVFRDCSVADAEALERPEEFVGDVVRRLLGQWPALADHVEQVWTLAERALPTRDRWPSFDQDAYLLDLIGLLRTAGHAVNPWYYDLPAAAVEARFPGLARPTAPPPGVPTIIEEPPFVVPRPVTAPAPAGDARPLLLKASVDAYRADLLPKLFPDAEVRIVHLVRNPAAAINGLYDGWLDRGFYSHDLTGRATLAIDGYSHLGWGRTRWNFDLPPGWREVAAAPLAEVCAFQWRQAHAHALDAGRDWPGPWLQVHAEDVMAGGERRRAALAAILGLAGADPAELGSTSDAPVMATTPPAPGRWRRRADVLAPALATAATAELAVALGYGAEPNDRWT